MKGLEPGDGESNGRIMSGLVRVGDGRPEGMWEETEAAICTVRAPKALKLCDCWQGSCRWYLVFQAGRQWPSGGEGMAEGMCMRTY